MKISNIDLRFFYILVQNKKDLISKRISMFEYIKLQTISIQYLFFFYNKNLAKKNIILLSSNYNRMNFFLRKQDENFIQ